MRFESLILKNLFRRPMRSLLTLLALTTAVAAIVSLLGIAQGFTQSFRQIYETHAIDIVVSRQGSADRLSSSIAAGYADEIAKIPGVRRTAAVLLEQLNLEEQEIYAIPTQGLTRDSWLMEDYRYSARLQDSNQNDSSFGQADNENGGGEVHLGIHLAERLNAKVGDGITIFDESFTVTGIFKSPSTWENGSMILPLDQLQSLSSRQGQATYINVSLEQPVSAEAAETAIHAIQSLDGKLHPLTTDEFVEDDLRMKLAGAMAWMTSAIALILGAIGTLNTMLTSVMERTSEIGILRAIGWPKGRVIRMILLESCGLAVFASILGTILAMFLTWALSQAPAAKGILSPHIGGSVIAQGFVLGIGIGLIGAVLPAWRASRMLPTEAFREA